MGDAATGSGATTEAGEHPTRSSATNMGIAESERFMGPVFPTSSWSGQRRAFPAPMRRRILQRDPTCRCPGCDRCTPTGCTRASTIADHIVNHAECVRRGVEPDTLANGQGLCAACHDVKTAAERAAGIDRKRGLRPKPRHPSDGGGESPRP